MRSSAMSIVLAAALLFQCYTGSMTASLSSEAFGDDEIAENAVGAAETAILQGRNGGGGAKVIVVADAGLWRNLWANNEGLITKQRAGADSGLTALQRRDVPEQDRFVVIRKDAMRCMVGRVYRPCWELEQ